jgi:hypothetical protein
MALGWDDDRAPAERLVAIEQVQLQLAAGAGLEWVDAHGRVL